MRSVRSARAEDVGLDKVGREQSRLGQPLRRVVDELLPLLRRRGEAVGGGAALVDLVGFRVRVRVRGQGKGEGEGKWMCVWARGESEG